MHSSTDKIVENLLGKVGRDKGFYTPQSLSQAGLPKAIVENIKANLQIKIDEDLHLQTAWSQSDHPSVQQLKKALKEQLYERAHIPAESLKELLSEAVESTLKVYLQPRKYLAEVFFQDDEQLGYDEIVKRTGRLFVYKHIGQAIPQYMKKRDLGSLTKERCKELVEKLDDHLTKTYEAEDWAKVLDLLRKLGDGKINADLVAIFFEDKAMDEVAEALKNTVQKELDRDRLIEIIADPDSVDERTKSGRANEPSDTSAMFSEDEEKGESRLVDQFADEEIEEEPEEPEEDENSFNRMFSEEESEAPIFQEFEEEIEEDDLAEAVDEPDIIDEPEKEELDQRQIAFSEEIEKEEEEEQIDDEVESPKQSQVPLQDEEDDEEKAEDDEDELNSWVTGDDDTGEELFDSEEHDGDAEDEDEPIWQQFMSPEEKEALKREEESEEDEIITEEHIFGDEPDEETGGEEEAQPRTKSAELKNYLLDKEPVFVNELYQGDRNEYEESLSRLENQKSWKEASDFLEKNVFSAYQIDMFSEAAIDFTDRLQSYFDEYKS
ncbi:hypothetical protein [Gracilimonas sp.]|uniref:hypothetical protein n=1 Tax=Gracilimonas sp. TaxID=1974203 RepID=UPI00287235C0|nr:hypothetical protein [Gracilimonas sp.]